MPRIDFSQVITATFKADQARAAARERIKERRNAAVAAGIIIGGIAVHTDDQSQLRITSAALAAVMEPGTVINWKTAEGDFVQLDAGQIIAIARAVRAHVQACFDREVVLLAALEAGEDYTLDEGWPV